MTTIFAGCDGCEGEPPQYYVYFMDGNEQFAKVKTAGNEMIIAPEPYVEDKIFLGWYFDEGTWSRPWTNSYLLYNKITQDLIIYARWA